MSKDSRFVIKQIFIYGFGRASTQLIGIVLIPVYTRLLTPADYGMLTSINIIVSVLIPFLTMGLQGSLFRYYYEYDSEDDRCAIIRSLVIGVTFISFVIIGAAILCADALSSFLLKSVDCTSFLRIALLTAFFNTATILPISLFRIRQQAHIFVALSLGQFVLGLVLNIFFVVIRREGVMGILYAGLCTSVASFLVIYPATLWQVGVAISWEKLRRALAYGVFLVPDSIAGMAMNMADRWFLQRFSSLTELGLYSVGCRFPQFLQHLVNAPTSHALGPYLYSIMKHEDCKRIHARVMTYVVILSLIPALLIALNADNLMRVFTTPPYYRGGMVIPLIALGFVFANLNWMFGWGISYAEKTSLYAIVTISSAVFSVIGNWLAVPRFGMMGAALIAVISYFFMCTITYFLSQRVYQIQYEFGRIFVLFLIGFALYAFGQVLHVKSLIANIVVQTSIGFSMIALIFLLRILNQPERRMLKATFAAVGARFIGNFRSS